MSDVKDLFSQHYASQFSRIMEEFKKVDDYVAKNFSDVEWSVEFNDDSQNPLGPKFHIKPRLFTGRGMSMGDRLLLNKQLTITITPEIWEDPNTMNEFIKQIYPLFTHKITEAVNDWYKLRKAKTGHSTPSIVSLSTKAGTVAG